MWKGSYNHRHKISNSEGENHNNFSVTDTRRFTDPALFIARHLKSFPLILPLSSPTPFILQATLGIGEAVSRLPSKSLLLILPPTSFSFPRLSLSLTIYIYIHTYITHTFFLFLLVSFGYSFVIAFIFINDLFFFFLHSLFFLFNFFFILFSLFVDPISLLKSLLFCSLTKNPEKTIIYTWMIKRSSEKNDTSNPCLNHTTISTRGHFARLCISRNANE